MKKEKVQSLLIGVVLLALWVLDLFHFFDLPKVWLYIKGGYLALGWLAWLLFLLDASGLVDSDGKYGKHSCDFCGGKIKIGEGKHWPTSDGCKCACAKCLPTVDDRNISKD